MEYDNEGGLVNFFAGLLLGAVIGAGVALLSAPQSGRRARRRLRRAVVDMKDSATDRWEDLADDVKQRVDDAIEGARAKFPG